MVSFFNNSFVSGYADIEGINEIDNELEFSSSSIDTAFEIDGNEKGVRSNDGKGATLDSYISG